jgi:hypothetical protein
MTCLVPACAAFGQAASSTQAATSPATAATSPAPTTYGWRGNWTGLYPDCTAPAEWGRIAKGVTAGMTCQAARPAEGAGKSGMDVDRGLIRDWLVLGPLPVKDSVKEFPDAQVPDEPKLAPAEGQKVGELTWTRQEIKKKLDYEAWGTTELEWLDLGKAVGFKPNQVAYAFTYLYCEHPGTAVMVVDHGHGFKAWINGQEAYSNPARDMALGNYVGISRYKQELRHGKSPSFKLTFAKGWNRLLVKVGTDNHKTWEEMRFTGRLYDPDPTAYEDKNIAWMTKLPERTNACPLIVGDRIFTPAEPDELICLDKATGKVLWRRFNTLYDATPQADRDANPVFKDKIAPLMEELAKNEDYEKGLELRRKLQTLLVSVDKAKYTLKWDGHFAAHFGIVGFTTTPVSDGKNVYAFFGYGVVACYDLDGNRKWIRRLTAKELVYSCSPALAGGKLMCVFGGLHGLDAATGDEAWTVPGVGCTASLIPMRVNGTDAVAVPRGMAYAASDGRVVWKNPQLEGSPGGGWGAALFLDNKIYLNFLGVASFTEADFTGVAAEPWKAKMRYFEIEANHHRPNGEWLDRSSPASPLIVNGVTYAIDEYGMLYALDLKTGKTYYQQETGFDELHSYVHIGVAASPTLIGKNVVVMDNQGCALVFEPGPTFKKVAMNRIETMLPRDWPIPPQEITANGPPVCDGERIYIRGEQYMYCIGRR